MQEWICKVRLLECSILCTHTGTSGGKQLMQRLCEWIQQIQTNIRKAGLLFSYWNIPRAWHTVLRQRADNLSHTAVTWAGLWCTSSHKCLVFPPPARAGKLPAWPKSGVSGSVPCTSSTKSDTDLSQYLLIQICLLPIPQKYPVTLWVPSKKIRLY